MARKLYNKGMTSSLTLIVKPAEDPTELVDADKFIATASKWLSALSTFASDQGLHVRWEIAGLEQSSAIVEVIPVDVTTGLIASDIASKWDSALREVESTGRPPDTVQPTSLRAMAEFVSSTSELSVAIRSGAISEPHPISAATQKRLLDAVSLLPPQEYQITGTVRGRLAVLNSWNPKERWFRLQLPLAPDKYVKCVYGDVRLIEELGQTFEHLLEVTGTLHYELGQPWPFHIDVDRVRQVPQRPSMTIDELIGTIKLPPGVDSVSFVRGLRDAE
jgi:hypothetical protein